MALDVETPLVGTRSYVEMCEKCGPRNRCHMDDLSCIRLVYIEAGGVLRHFRKSCAGPFIVMGLNKQLLGSMQNPRRNQILKFDAETMVSWGFLQNSHAILDPGKAAFVLFYQTMLDFGRITAILGRFGQNLLN